jgi:hypothetical protein
VLGAFLAFPYQSFRTCRAKTGLQACFIFIFILLNRRFYVVLVLVPGCRYSYTSAILNHWGRGLSECVAYSPSFSSLLHSLKHILIKELHYRSPLEAYHATARTYNQLFEEIRARHVRSTIAGGSVVSPDCWKYQGISVMCTAVIAITLIMLRGGPTPEH